MNPWQKIVLARHLVEGRSYSDIAGLMGCSKKTVRRNAVRPEVWSKVNELSRRMDEQTIHRIVAARHLPRLMSVLNPKRARR